MGKTKTKVVSIASREANLKRKLRRHLQALGFRKSKDGTLEFQGSGKTITQLAAEAGVCGPYFCRVLRLSFLAPEIVEAVLRDRHPLELSAKHLALRTRLHAAWDEQRDVLGLN